MRKGDFKGYVGIFLLLFSVFMCFPMPKVLAKEPIVIVIDPGHGGENEGGKTDEYTEKMLTIRVAQAMQQELEKYEDVVIYLTRTDDVDMSLQERVDFAKEKNADFFVCLHFNMSEYHTLFGEECWVSAFGNCYAKGMDFARIEDELLSGLGLHSRGVKTRLSSKGIDYYGVIRAATEYDIPSVIVEHCHMDHAFDAPYIDHDTWLETYGKLDATAVAKTFGLQSQELQCDYSQDANVVTPVPAGRVDPDKTGPDEVQLREILYDESAETLLVKVYAREAYSKLCYYQYSLGEEQGYSSLFPWKGINGDEHADEMTIMIPCEKTDTVSIRISNNYDLYTDSEPVLAGSVPTIHPIVEEKKEMQEVNTSHVQPVFQEKRVEKTPTSSKSKSQNGMWFVVIIAVLVSVELVVIRRGMKRGKKRGKKI